MVTHARLGLVADDVGKDGGVADAGHGCTPHAGIAVVLGEGRQRVRVGRIELVNRFDADVGIGVGGLGLRAELVENSHGVSDPGGPCGRPTPSFLECTSAGPQAREVVFGDCRTAAGCQAHHDRRTVITRGALSPAAVPGANRYLGVGDASIRQVE